MDKICLIIKREYLVRIRKKSFIVMTLLGPLLMLLVMFLPIYLTNQTQTERTIAISEQDFDLFNKLENTDYINFVVTPVSVFSELKLNFEDELYYALLEKKENEIILSSNKQVSLSVSNEIKSQLEKKIEQKNLVELGIDIRLLEQAKTKVVISNQIISKDGIGQKSKTELSMAIGFISGLLIYIFIFMYGTMVMRSIIEEKTNRIVEVIISSVKPFKLMMGKIIGVSLIGLTQFVLWICLTSLLFFIAQGYFGNIAEVESTQEIEMQSMMLEGLMYLNNINLVEILLAFLFYFLGGYLMYGSLFAAVGSAVDAEADSQQFILPVTIPLILSFILIQPIMENPDSSLAFWMSIFPLTSPIIMMVRIPFGVSDWELLVSILVLIGSFILSTKFAAKIYRTGILMYGKKINYKELWKWLRYKG
ncbi:MAG: ABC transporter permease [Flavobacteriales bacterium]|nr:ABC transporter permease [Flavobacteriales bacterium]|tara:strand:+ start:1913 stop:3175 length:1263 start_codon:yes stop_codon:yes gene_type:complete